MKKALTQVLLYQCINYTLSCLFNIYSQVYSTHVTPYFEVPNLATGGAILLSCTETPVNKCDILSLPINIQHYMLNFTIIHIMHNCHTNFTEHCMHVYSPYKLPTGITIYIYIKQQGITNLK